MRPLQEAILAALRSASRLVERGHEAVVVGGAVRGLLLGRGSTEADLATSAPLDQVLELWPGAPVVGRPPAATVITRSGGHRVDISSFQGGGMEEDLGRRDLTINAMAVTVDGMIVDPWGGRADLAKGLLRFTGDPRERLSSDPLRAVRLARFAAELPSFRVDPASSEACPAFAPRVASLPPSRVGRETLKALDGDLPTFLESLERQGIAASVLPFWDDIPNGRKASTLERVRRACSLTGDRAVRAACMLADSGPGVGAMVPAWGWPKGLARETGNLLKYRSLAFRGGTAGDWAALFRSHGAPWLGKLHLFGYIDGPGNDPSAVEARAGGGMESAMYLLRLQAFGRRVTGGEVTALTGIERGPRIGAILADLDGAIALGEVKDRRQALRRVLSHLP